MSAAHVAGVAGPHAEWCSSSQPPVSRVGRQTAPFTAAGPRAPCLSARRCQPVCQQAHQAQQPLAARFSRSPAPGGGVRCSVANAVAAVASPPLAAPAYAQAQRPVQDDPPTYVKATGRVVAIGDIHGDLPKAIRSLEVAGVLGEIDGRPLWTGGDTVVVQLGDVLDRGDCEIGVVLLLRELDRQARLKGGAVYMLNGNHESLNICGDFRYVTAGAFLESAAAAGLRGDSLGVWDNQLRARLRLYSPGGPMATELAKNPTVLVVNDTVFVHGGLLMQHVKYGLERLNNEVASWMRGDLNDDGSHVPPPFAAMGSSNSVMWNRTYGKEQWGNPYDRYHACNQLQQVLEACGVSRMVVGHTPQMCGCNNECDGRVWRVDVGMSSGVLDAAPQALFIDRKPDGKTEMSVAADSGVYSTMAGLELE